MILLQATIEALPAAVNDDFISTLIRFGWRICIDVVSVYLLLRWIYFPTYKHRELFFTFFTFNLVIFLISFLLNKAELSMGAAFGLFAVFSMLRYRTEDLGIKDMTYLFLVIAMGLISAVTRIPESTTTGEYLLIALLDLLLLAVTFVFESKLFFKKESVKEITYEKIDLIKPGKESELMEDLKSRTGIPVHRVSIGKIDFIRDTAQIKAYYYE